MLSWAGRNDEARVLFEQVLATKPDDPRATRGLARTYAWSGQRTKANVWYIRALDLEDDAEARQEWSALRSELKKQVGANGFSFHDSEKFSYLRSGLEASMDWDFDTRIYASTGDDLASATTAAPTTCSPARRSTTRGIEGRLGVERRLAPQWKGDRRSWAAAAGSTATTMPLARGVLEYDPSEDAVARARGRARATSSSTATRSKRCCRASSARAASSRTGRQITPTWEGYVEARRRVPQRLERRDRRSEAASRGDPFAPSTCRSRSRSTRMHYQDFSPYYYSPDIDLGATLSLMGRVPICGALALVFDGGGGAGFSQEQGASSTSVPRIA